MKRYTFIFLIILNLQLALSNLQQQKAIDNCEDYFQIRDIQNSYNKNQKFCIKCKQGYIVNQNFQSCIDIRHSESQFQLIYCKRIASNGTCAEPIDEMVMYSNYTFSYVGERKVLERCAIVSLNGYTCLYPRFGYILDVNKDVIMKDSQKTFCALYNSQNRDCLEFQGGFLRIEGSQSGMFIGDSMINPDLILPSSNSKRIICQVGSELIQNRFIKGCFSTQMLTNQNKIQINNCKEMMNEIQCKVCQEGYALRNDKQKCQAIVKNCSEYVEIQSQNLCIQCLPFYQLIEQICVSIPGCLLISRKYANKCLACVPMYELQDGKCIKLQHKKQEYTFNFQDDYGNDQINLTTYKVTEGLNSQNTECLVMDQDQCLKCRDENFYFDQIEKKCKKRVRSLNCVYQVHNQDECLNLECEQNYQINSEIFEELDLKDQMVNYYIEEYLNKQFLDSDYLMADEEVQSMKQDYQKRGALLKNKIYCMPKQTVNLENCIEFDLLKNKCLKCKQGYFLTIQNEASIPNLITKCSNHLQIINLQIDKCISYDIEKSFCYECEEGYYFNSKVKKCRQKINNCVIHNLFSECLLCEEGYSLNSQNTCSINIIKELNIFESLQQNSSFCAEFLNNKCSLCEEGFVMDKSNNSQCILDYLFPDCIEIDFINDDSFQTLSEQEYIREDRICTKCRKGYTLQQGICKKETKLSKNKNTRNKCNNELTNCLMCDDSRICLQCEYQYTFNEKNNQCIKKQYEQRFLKGLEPVKDGCQLFDDEGRCKFCKDNLFLMTDFKCYDECPSDYTFQYDHKHGIVCYTCPLECKKCQFDYMNLIAYKQIKCSSCINGLIFHADTFQCKKVCDQLTLEDSGFCVQKCKDSYFLSQNRCLKSCPLFYEEINDEKICIQDCQGMYKYTDDPKKCSTNCDEGYATMVNVQICKKCTVKQCKKCDAQNVDLCLECKAPYTNINNQCKYQCKNKLIVDEIIKCDKNIDIPYCAKQLYDNCQTCLDTFELTDQFECSCPEGTFFNLETNQCELCGLRCLQCDKNQGCITCAEYYYKVQVFDKFECTNNCGIGYFPNQEKQVCSKCSQYCLKCSTNTNCDECFPSFQKLIRQEYQSNQSYCQCPLNFSVNQEKSICELQCKDGYKSDTLKCCEISNCQNCNKSHLICEKCNKNYPYLFQNTCLKECPEGYYQDDSEYKCKKCSPLCKTCTSDEQNCQSCSLTEEKIEDRSCKCKQNKVFFQNECYQECPQYTTISKDQKICEEYCTDLSYPVFDELGRFERCEFDLGQPDSQFCYQNLGLLSRLIDFSIDDQKRPNNKESITLIASVSKTPKDCYIFKLRGKSDNDSFHLIYKLKDQKSQDLFNLNFNLESEIELNSNQESNQIECNPFFCTLYLEVYLKNALQQIYKLKVNIESNSVVVEGLQDLSILLNEQSNSVIPEQIPIDQVQHSMLQIQCNSSNYCSQKGIKAEVNSPVNIDIQATFKFGSSEDNLLTVYPLSVYVLLENQLRLPINTFYYDNFFPSTIRMIVYFEQQIKGELIIILRAYNQKYLMKGLEFFSYENNYLKFIFQRINVQIIDTKKSKNEKEELGKQDQQNIEGQSQQFDSTYQIFILLNTFVSIIFLIKVFIYCFRKIKNKINLPQQTDQVDILNITEEKSTSHQQQVSIELS